MAKKIKEEKKEANGTKERIKNENKILRNILIGIGFFILGIIIISIIVNASNSFTYRGVKFNIVKFCDSKPCLVTYKTSLPVKPSKSGYIVTTPNQKTNYYDIYLKVDPRVNNVNFNGNLTYNGNVVFNVEGSDFICNGTGGIAGANFNLLYQLLGSSVISDQNATCDIFNRYTLVIVQPGNETRIDQFGPSCYNIYINNCRVLEGTERYMLEELVKVNDALYNQSY